MTGIDVFVRRACVSVVSAVVILVASPIVPSLFANGARDMAFAQSQAPSEAEAFEAAKSLGTADAWQAFVTNYPTGFRADLARAYLKQLADKTPTSPQIAPPPPQQASAPEQPAYEQSCEIKGGFRSRESSVPAKIRFINPTDGTYVLQWIDFNGALKEFGTIAPGGEITQDTFLTHPWIVAYGEGSCRQLFIAAEGGVSIARIKPESELQKKKAAPPVRQQPVATKPPPAPPLKCAANYRKVGNECVMMQNCGPNATRNPEGDCFCNRGAHMMNGQCTIPSQQPSQCGRNEVYSSSMGQCIPRG